MRSIFLAAILFTAACAATPRHTNVASVRHEISGTIRSQENDRTIHSMGKVSNDRAVVYTTSSTGTKQEETWVKSGSAWKLENKTAITQAR